MFHTEPPHRAIPLQDLSSQSIPEVVGADHYLLASQVLQDSTLLAARLKGGGVLILPTDTIYGLSVRASDEAALDRLYRLKGRSLENQIPVLIEDPGKTLPHWVEDLPEKAEKLIAAFWPGPLTLVLRAKPHLPKLLVGAGSIGLRQSAHPVVRSVIRALGEPITGTSANITGAPSPFSLQQISPSVLRGVDFVVDGGALPGRKGSTVLDFTGPEIKILRQGDLPLSRIREVIAL